MNTGASIIMSYYNQNAPRFLQGSMLGFERNMCAQFKSPGNDTFPHLTRGVEDTLKAGKYEERSERVPAQVE